MITMCLNKQDIMNNFGDLFDLTHVPDDFYESEEVQPDPSEDDELPELEGQIDMFETDE